MVRIVSLLVSRAREPLTGSFVLALKSLLRVPSLVIAESGVAGRSHAFKAEKHLAQLAAIAEMCDRTVHEVWMNDLSAVLHEY